MKTKEQQGFDRVRKLDSVLKHKNLSAWLFLLMIFFIALPHARAELYCDKTIENRYEQDRQNAIMKDIAAFDTAYGSPNSFDSLYCGAQISSAFDSIGQKLVGGIDGQVDNLINQLFQKACKSAIAPIQNAAAQTCVPNFTKSYFDPNLSNNAFNQNQTSVSQSQAAACLANLVARNPGRDISTVEVTLCLIGNLNQPIVLACLIDLFSDNKSRTITLNDINYCLDLGSTGAGSRLNYCPGTQLIQVTPIIGGSGFSGGSTSSYPQLFW